MLERHGCSAIAPEYLESSILNVTVRRPNGETYVVQLNPYSPASVFLKVGDPWQP